MQSFGTSGLEEDVQIQDYHYCLDYHYRYSDSINLQSFTLLKMQKRSREQVFFPFE